jgi:hypothetical protein
MVARFDKYDPLSGGFRAEAAVDNLDTALWDLPLGTSINAAGKAVVHGAGQTDFTGVCIIDRTKRRAGAIQDIMTHGEIVYSPTTPLVAGTVYYLDADGDLTDAPGRFRVGHTVEAWRLIVRFTDLGEVA